MVLGAEPMERSSVTGVMRTPWACDLRRGRRLRMRSGLDWLVRAERSAGHDGTGAQQESGAEGVREAAYAGERGDSDGNGEDDEEELTTGGTHLACGRCGRRWSRKGWASVVKLAERLCAGLLPTG